VTGLHHSISKRIHRELADLERTVERAVRAWEKAPVAIDQDIYLDSAALNLQSFYGGLERLFEQIARHIDGDVPSGEAWHLQLLQQMGHDDPGMRPALLSKDSIIKLNEFRKFRHVVRNIYATNLELARMQDLFKLLPDLWPHLRAELLAFAEFLELLSSTEGNAE
jgi:hypothetical protein